MIQEHFTRLKKDVEAWNKWRGAHPEIRPDLSEADLRKADLRKANLRKADLSYTDLSYTSLSGADLSEARLSRANLRGAYLTGVNLTGVDLTGARIGWTIFGGCDLQTIKGLEQIEHRGPSTVGIDTIYRSKGHIPDIFLRGTGVDDTFIDYMGSLTTKPIEYYTCFISYSSENQEFAQRLYTDLQANHVRCWFSPEDLKIGDQIRQRIDDSIWVYDKLLLILSHDSIISQWIEMEIETALRKERERKQIVLFPIRIDDTVQHAVTPRISYIRDTRHIGDFTNWKDYDTYQKGLQRLLRDLKQGE